MNQFLEHFRIADLLDIVVMTVLLYAGISWMKRRISHAVIVGLALVGLLYVAARVLQMYLTLLLFQVGIVIIVFSLVVIFQQDLRRGFERLAAWRLRWPGRKHQHHPELLDQLVEAAGTLAEQRTGALFVLKGREPLDGHVRGGTPLDGEISIPLLLSLFDSGTPGHDGAALIVNGRLQMFGAHLPLSQDLAQVKGKGTRHTAALGLAERSDALVVVVSEERGTISIAHEGVLSELESAAALKERLTEFEQHFSGRRRASPGKWLASQAATTLLAVGLAFVLWVSLAYQVDQVDKPLEGVPIEYRNLPDGLVLDSSAPAKINLTVTGAERALQAFDERQLKVSVNLEGRSEGPITVPISQALLNLPERVTLRPDDAHTIEFQLFRKLTLPVKVNVQEKTLPEGYSLGEVTTTPGEVTVFLINAVETPLQSVSTRPIRLDSVNKTTTVKTQLEALPSYARFPNDQPPEVEVTITITPE
jgi:uncharacterized protein (TIGR00159 family)